MTSPLEIPEIELKIVPENLPPDANAEQVKQAIRTANAFAARRHGQSLLRSFGLFDARMLGCGTSGFRQAVVNVYASATKASGKVTGICVCGQSICCPVCAPRIMAERAQEITDSVQQATLLGLQCTMATYTLPHTSDDRLEDLIQLFRRAYDIAFSGRNGVEARKQRKCYWLANEVTYSHRNGNHPHGHLAFFHEKPLDEDLYRDNWRRGAYEINRYSKGWEEHALDFLPVDIHGAKYIAKIGLELAYNASKNSWTALACLLEDMREPGPLGPAFVEMIWTLSKLRVPALKASHGLRQIFGLKSEKTDEQLAQEHAECTDELLGHIIGPDWNVIFHYGREFEVIRAAQKGVDAVNAVLSECGLGPMIEPAREKAYAIGHFMDETLPLPLELPAPAAPVMSDACAALLRG